jgi:hypothetical protein
MKNFRRVLLALGLSGCLGLAGSGCARQSAVAVNGPVVAAGNAVPRATPAPAVDEKSPAGDRASKLVAEVLRPSDKVATLPWQDYEGQRRLPGPRFLEQPELPLPPDPGELPRTPVVQSARPVRPQPLPEEPSLARRDRSPDLPERPRLPVGPLVRLPGPDLNQPVPVPILAQPLPDRAPLTDPSGEASLAAALAQPMPVRTTPAPFVALNLPDPFANQQAVRLASPPEEDPNPPVMGIRTPAP